MSIKLDLEYQNIKYDQQDETAMFTITGPDIDNSSRLPPKSVCFVLDVSGSMAQHEIAMKKALLSGINKLRDIDQVCVLTYSDNANVLCEWNTVTDSLKKMIKDRCDKLFCNGGTNISGAIFQAIDQSYLLDSSKSTVIFFTDGKANKGVTDINRLAMMVKNILGTEPYNSTACTIHTCGFGSNHERTFLETISNIGKGKYNYIENDDHLADAFQDIIGDTLEVGLQNVKLTLRADNINFQEYDTTNEVNELNLDDSICGKSRQYLVSLRFLGEHQTYTLHYNLTAINVTNGEKICIENICEIKRGDNNALVENVVKRKKELQAVTAIQKAREEAEKGNMNAAFNLIHETSMQMEGLPDIRDNLNLLSQDLLAPELYTRRGNFRMSSMERAVSENVSSYFNQTPEKLLGLSPIKVEKKVSITPTTTPTSLNSGTNFENQ